MGRGLLVIVLLAISASVMAQKPMSITIKDPVVCYAHTENHPLNIPEPLEYLERKKNKGARTNGAVFVITYVGFEFAPQAKAAFDLATEIWGSVLTSSVPIHLEVRWTGLAPNVLGSANYTGAHANFRGAQKINVFYPVAIAEKISGQNLNGDTPDIFANFNSAFDWHYDPTTPVPAGKYDLTTVVLHEIGHGLGFSGTFTIGGGQGQFGLQGTGVPIIYDVTIEDGIGVNLIEGITSPSESMSSQLVGNNLFFNSPSGRRKIYAPTTFSGGSSISHLDESTYGGFSQDALMTPQIAPMEKIRNPGISLGMLKDMGWETVRIDHNFLFGYENIAGPYPISAKIIADNGYDAESVTLHYTRNGQTFTTVTMTSTGANTFTANIPGDGSPGLYGYFISVENNSGTEYVNPGKRVRPKDVQLQQIYVFETGPDTESPIITHAKKTFQLDSESELVIDAVISDNTGSVTATLEYFINDDEKPAKTMTLTAPEYDSVYTATLDIDALVNGDVIKYRIVAIDHANNPNSSTSPATGFHILNVVGLGATQDSYANDFESAARDEDFFGSGYSIQQTTGFSNRAIHSQHPYASGAGFPNSEQNFIYQLRYPIRVQAADATLKFDEVALIEPGAPGSVYGDADFYDYVVVEGSIDGGQTWKPLAPGYDARSQSAWLTRWNSAVDISTGTSTATGISSLYRPRTIDLLQAFDAGDEIIVRFRLFSDELAVGWGWTIDNLKIQIDETAPLILHDHVDFIKPGTEELLLASKVSDGAGVSEYALEFFVNTQEPEVIDFDVDPLASQYNFTLSGIDALTAGDVINYRFIAKDINGNENAFPAQGYIKVPILNFGTAVAEYTNDFNSATTDFVGNFFSVTKPDGFNDGAIHSNHFYPMGMGLNQTSNFSYMLKKPIVIAETNTFIRFKEIALVEAQASNIAFGTAAFNDYVIVEGSTDNGVTWKKFANGYDAVSQTQWLTAVNNNSVGNPAFYKNRTINMTSSGDFEAGDEVIIRFRLFSNATVNAWGWAIDDLYIQSTVTGVEDQLLNTTTAVYPNPAKDKFTVEADAGVSPEFTIEVVNMQGQKIYAAKELAVNGKMVHTIAATQFTAGMYLVKVSNGKSSTIRKVVRTN